MLKGESRRIFSGGLGSNQDFVIGNDLEEARLVLGHQEIQMGLEIESNRWNWLIGQGDYRMSPLSL
jgi:hypothetical protein